ncbi:hypothetical protein M885DRAFT_626676 [Pelagophyceae sp. CCMP2097]|nr:hypothetical protein M885DRAFT_626676 [Pelagophyceae sp. CCMP2097]
MPILARAAIAAAAAASCSLASFLWCARAAPRVPPGPAAPGDALFEEAGPRRDPPAAWRGTANVLVSVSGVKKLAAFEREPESCGADRSESWARPVGARSRRRGRNVVQVTLEQLAQDDWGGPTRFECILCEAFDATGRTNTIGFAVYSFSTWQGNCLYLYDLFIEEPYRGAGTLLLRSVAAVAAAEGCARFHWRAPACNEPAIRFYTALGAKRLTGWVSLHMGRPETSHFVGGGEGP